jgi:hypothetical protein
MSLERFTDPKIQLDYMLNVFFHKYQTFHYSKIKEHDKMVCQMPVGGGKGPIFMTDILEKSLSAKQIFTLATHRRILNHQHFVDLLKLLTPLAGEIIFINNSSLKFDKTLIKHFDYKVIDKLNKLSVNLRINYGEYRNCDFDNYLILGKILKEQTYYPINYTEEELNEFLTYRIYKKKLGRIDFSSTIFNTTNPVEIRNIISNPDNKDKNIVIISTYDSLGSLGKIVKGITKTPTGNKFYELDLDPLDIDTIYFDEAHELATEETLVTEGDKEAFFKRNYKTLKFKKAYFFSATPKESDDENTTSFLMNNPEYFGPTYTTSFRECVDIGQIVSPYLHRITPRNYEDFENNIVNRSNFVIDGFIENRIFLKKMSSNPDIGGKTLVKCKNIKDDAKGIYDYLKDHLCDILEAYDNLYMDRIFICVGGMYNEGQYDSSGNFIKGSNKQKAIHKISQFILDANKKWVCIGEKDFNKINYLQEIKNKDIKTNMIVLHFDTLSEGINVNGFTSIMFISGNILSETKIIQNLGRASRLTYIDRYNLRERLISLKDKNIDTATVLKKTWEKPFFAIIIPYWDDSSESAMDKIVSIYDKLVELLGGRVRILSSVIGNPEGNQKTEIRKRKSHIENGDEFDDEFEHLINLKLKIKKEEEISRKFEEEIIINLKKKEDEEISLLKMATEEDDDEYYEYYYLGKDDEKLNKIDWLKNKYFDKISTEKSILEEVDQLFDENLNKYE